MDKTIETFAEFAWSLRFEDLPPEVVHAARRHLVDSAGVALAAAGTCAPLVDAARSWGGAREAAIIGEDAGAPAAWAALCNGALMRALSFDDTHPASLVHCSAAVAPAALAVGEESETRGADVLAAYACGVEIASRVGAAAPGRFQARGLDTTSVAGAFGAAAAAARLWGLSRSEMGAALRLCANGGPLPAPAHPLRAGLAAWSGVLAADLARRGASGPDGAIEDLYASLLRGESPDLAGSTRDMGERWETTRMAVRAFPASHFVQAFMDAAIGAGVKWGDIEEVECLVAPAVVPLVCEPRIPRLHPGSAAAARASLPFAVAVAIVGGREELEMFGDEALADRRVLTLAERIHHVADPTLPFPATFGGRLRIHTRAGRTLEIDEVTDRGHPDRPLTDDEVRDKFLRNARARLDANRARRALNTVWAFEDAASVGSSLRMAPVEPGH